MTSFKVFQLTAMYNTVHVDGVKHTAAKHRHRTTWSAFVLSTLLPPHHLDYTCILFFVYVAFFAVIPAWVESPIVDNWTLLWTRRLSCRTANSMAAMTRTPGNEINQRKISHPRKPQPFLILIHLMREVIPQPLTLALLPVTICLTGKAEKNSFSTNV